MRITCLHLIGVVGALCGIAADKLLRYYERRTGTYVIPRERKA